LAKAPDLERQAEVLLALLEDCCALLPAWMRGRPAGDAAGDDVAQVLRRFLLCHGSEIAGLGTG
jgi:hypothetical protein